jgi:hypothetical protein
MLYEPDTVWGRTVDGDSEIAKPRNGLSLTQRKVLKRLEHPRPFATFAAQNRLPPPKLEHELLALAKLRLVAYQRPGAPQPRTAPPGDRPQSVTPSPPAAAVAQPQPASPAGTRAPAMDDTVNAQRNHRTGNAQQALSLAVLLPLCFAAAALGIASVLLILG